MYMQSMDMDMDMDMDTDMDMDMECMPCTRLDATNTVDAAQNY
jgi:hypothetical protein